MKSVTEHEILTDRLILRAIENTKKACIRLTKSVPISDDDDHGRDIILKVVEAIEAGVGK